MRYASTTLGILRIVTGLLFLPHGGQKLFGWLGGMDGSGATAAFPSLMWFAGVIEFVAGVLVLLGVFSRPAAFLAAGEMAVAYFTAHAGRAPLPLANHGELAVLYCFLFLHLCVAGPGRFALDSLWHHGVHVHAPPEPHFGRGTP